MCNSVNPTHLRYLKLTVDVVRGRLPQVLSSFCHLQVLDIGSNTHLNLPDGMYNLVSLRHLVAASIARIGTLTSLQALSNFSIQDSIGFQITELQSMNDLAQLRLSQLQNIKTREEACGAGLRYKRHLENLHLSWNMSNDEYDSDDSDECEEVKRFEPSTSIETEECSQAEVLEGLQPYNNLKHLQISRYNGATSPSWLSSNISATSLQTLHLENCRKWRVLPSLQRLPLLRKLKLRGMPKVVKILVPSLEELVLIKMPNLETCSCTSVRKLNSCLRILKIKNCTALKVFNLFGNSHEFKIEQKSWLPRLCELIIHNCPLLLLPHHLPSSSTVSRISMRGVSKFPRIDSQSYGSLTIGENPKVYDSDDEYDSDEDRLYKSADNLSVLDGNILAFHNPRFLTQLIISCCRNLMYISFRGLSQLVSLKKLRILGCPGLFGFDVPPDHTHEDLTAENWNALPSLGHLEIGSSGIAWKWLSLILQHAPALTELDLRHCPKLESLQLNSCTTLQTLSVQKCESLCTLEVLQSRSPRDMEVEYVPKLKSLQQHSCTALEAAVCVLEGSESLTKLKLYNNQDLKYLQLYSCTALENLENLDIQNCTSLSTIEGFQSLGSLRHLYLGECPGLHSCLEGLPVQDYELCPQLEVVWINDFSFLTTSFCRQLTSLHSLVIRGSVKETTAEGLTDEQERGLLLLGSLTEVQFVSCKYLSLKYLPPGLHRLHSLQVLEISFCPSISGLPVLPPSLKELRIEGGSEELKLQSKSLASSKLKVQIDGQYVN